jgi:Zn-dependent protease
MIGATVRLGRVGGVVVYANWTVLAIVWLLMWSLAGYVLPELASGYATGLYWVVGFLATLGLLLSILAHELSHAFVANRHGVHVEEITLWMFGGMARLSSQAGDAATELRIALAGPAMNVAVGVACLTVAGVGAALGGPELLTTAVGWLGGLNVLLAVFNLLPGAPLDGGPVLTAILWWRSGDERLARKRAAHT